MLQAFHAPFRSMLCLLLTALTPSTAPRVERKADFGFQICYNDKYSDLSKSGRFFEEYLVHPDEREEWNANSTFISSMITKYF